MLGHDEAAGIVEGQLREAEQLAGAHIAVEAGIAEADRAFFLAVELLVELFAARQAKAFSSEVGTGSREENAISQTDRAFRRSFRSAGML